MQIQTFDKAFVRSTVETLRSALESVDADRSKSAGAYLLDGLDDVEEGVPLIDHALSWFSAREELDFASFYSVESVRKLHEYEPSDRSTILNAYLEAHESIVETAWELILSGPSEEARS